VLSSEAYEHALTMSCNGEAITAGLHDMLTCGPLLINTSPMPARIYSYLCISIEKDTCIYIYIFLEWGLVNFFLSV
jgi:hypothetical protein